MKERLVTLGLAAAALALFWLLMFPKPESQGAVPRPLSSESSGEGYLGAYQWLTANKVPTTALHRRFDQLADATISPQPTGNLLITTLPFDVVPHPEEIAALDKWVGQGNTLVILAALDDTPLWSAINANFLPDLQSLTTLGFTARKDPAAHADRPALATQQTAMTPANGAIDLQISGRIALLQGVRRVATLTVLPSTQWLAQAQTPSPVLELARRVDNDDPTLWLKASGKGAVIISAYASVLGNSVIGKADNARLFANIVAWSLKPGGRVIFDDAHQGVLDEFDAEKFFADPRLHHTLLWLVALWLAWVLATQPLRPGAPNASGLDESAMLRVTASFFANVLRPVATAQWLFDEFFERLRRRHGLLQGAGLPWDWLASHAGVNTAALEELRYFHGRTQAGQKVNLVRLQKLISQISGQTS